MHTWEAAIVYIEEIVLESFWCNHFLYVRKKDILFATLVEIITPFGLKNMCVVH